MLQKGLAWALWPRRARRTLSALQAAPSAALGVRVKRAAMVMIFILTRTYFGREDSKHFRSSEMS